LRPCLSFSGTVGANGTAFAVEKQYAFREIFSKGSKFEIYGFQALRRMDSAASQGSREGRRTGRRPSARFRPDPRSGMIFPIFGSVAKQGVRTARYRKPGRAATARCSNFASGAEIRVNAAKK